MLLTYPAAALSQYVDTSHIVLALNVARLGVHGRTNDQIVQSIAIHIAGGQRVAEVFADLTACNIEYIRHVPAIHDNLAGQVGPARHANGHVVLAIAIEVTGDHRVAQVGVVVGRRRFGREEDLMLWAGHVVREGLTCGICRFSGSVWFSSGLAASQADALWLYVCVCVQDVCVCVCVGLATDYCAMLDDSKNNNNNNNRSNNNNTKLTVNSSTTFATFTIFALQFALQVSCHRMRHAPHANQVVLVWSDRDRNKNNQHPLQTPRRKLMRSLKFS